MFGMDSNDEVKVDGEAMPAEEEMPADDVVPGEGTEDPMAM